MQKSSSSSAKGPGLLKTLGIAATAAGLWILFVAGVKLQEMLVGAAAVAGATIFLLRVLHWEPLHMQFRARDLLQAWRIPLDVASRVVEISWLAVLDFAGRPVGSFYRYCGFRISRRDPVQMAQGVLATAYTTVAPNFIVIGIDPDQNHLMFHQLKRSSVPAITQELGAQR